MPLAPLGEDEFSIRQIFRLWQGQHYSNVFKLVQEESDSWWIHVNFGLAVAAICHYSFLAIVTVCIIWHLRKRRTGLKWSPTTLAAQLALIQGSNILDKFEEMDDTDSVNLEDEVKM
ncbi:hypothetical protein GGTG_07074 [Gaeumannomyces tritici R3-111a-1]|uniref:Uncharacterized protein n=1 Tax=Gaeumannomyces tritici (strain R3-111a-1) TaxID=644352 RepID=J3P0M9_GAET3|nr:hypothetical protein GGTG_07074 [Gaeumannomyces tritici R3-111a-1]EJT77162.1 hypothetical protein GGTG_07074 [Gaeumannomyces tritici R3-111a-1]